MDNPTSSNPNITPEMIEAGRFQITDVPGMMPSQEEIHAQAERLAREMYPEKFGLPPNERSFSYKIPPHNFPMLEGKAAMISPENFDKQNEVAQAKAAALETPLGQWIEKNKYEGPIDLASPIGPMQSHTLDYEPTPSPISRLFAAVRNVATVGRGVIGSSPDTEDIECWRLDELKAAYEALGLKDE